MQNKLAIFEDKKIRKNVENKMDEKMNIVLLDLVKKELEPIYKNMKKYLNDSKN